MTIRPMQRATAIFVLAATAAFGFVACGSSEPPSNDEASRDALALAEEATDAIDDLESRTDDLAEELDKVDSARRDLATKLDRIHGDLRDSVANLRASLSDIAADADSARDSAQSALGEIEAALERLAVLENRFDYHLRKDH